MRLCKLESATLFKSLVIMGAVSATCCADDPSKSNQNHIVDEGNLLQTEPSHKKENIALFESVPSDTEHSMSRGYRKDLGSEHSSILVPSAQSGVSAEHPLQPDDSADSSDDDDDDDQPQPDDVKEEIPKYGQNGHAPPDNSQDVNILEVSPMPPHNDNAEREQVEEQAPSESPVVVDTPIFDDHNTNDPPKEDSMTPDHHAPEESITAMTINDNLDLDSVQTLRAGQQFVFTMSGDESETRDSMSKPMRKRHPQRKTLENGTLKKLSVDLVTKNNGEFIKFVKKCLKSQLKDKIWKKCDAKGKGSIDQEKFKFFWILPVTLYKVVQYQRENKTKSKPQLDDNELRRECIHLSTWIIWKYGRKQADGGRTFVLEREKYDKNVIKYLKAYKEANGEIDD